MLDVDAKHQGFALPELPEFIYDAVIEYFSVYLFKKLMIVVFAHLDFYVRKILLCAKIARHDQIALVNEFLHGNEYKELFKRLAQPLAVPAVRCGSKAKYPCVRVVCQNYFIRATCAVVRLVYKNNVCRWVLSSDKGLH